MSWLVILGLILVGVIFLLLEILVVPGTTIVGLIGAGMVIGAVVTAFSTFGVQAGVLTLAGSLVISVLAIVLALKSNTWRKAMLNTEINGRVNVVEPDKIVVGDEGVSITRLNPMGKALIKDEFYEVTSKDNLINENTPLVVVKVDGNKIIVKPKP
ncbi:MAG: NfeD family protein [Bacteroides sp.]|jgi:membrane-bound ClpP family serine protease|nr:NfeD family protein [Bacteroides sp.]